MENIFTTPTFLWSHTNEIMFSTVLFIGQLHPWKNFLECSFHLNGWVVKWVGVKCVVQVCMIAESVGLNCVYVCLA